MSKKNLQNINGYSLFELVVVMIVISILMTASMRFMGKTVDVSKTEETKIELDQLAIGIVGDEQKISGNHRIDYGYVGDIGALPSNLNNLVTDPGLATWDGPYLKDDFYASSAATESEYAIDGWGKQYTYSGGVTISSTGGSTTITRELANNSDVLLYNRVSLNIVDLDHCPPGTIDKDSVRVNLTYPNGLGSYQTDSKFPFADGFVEFDSIPIGQQTLTIVELKNNDTLYRKIYINPNSLYHADVQFPVSLWCDTTGLSSGGGGGSGGGSGNLIYVNGTGQTSGGNCDDVQFDLKNNSGSNITITSITFDWLNPTGYYKEVEIGGTEVFDNSNPRNGTGQIINFPGITITPGEIVTVDIEGFKENPTGGQKVDMTNTDMTITLSDGSIIIFNTGPCL